MNLTFNGNSLDYKNNSYSPIIKKLTFPTIFSKFETEKNFTRDSLCIKMAKNKIFLPNYKNIKQEMIKIKKQFRSLFDIKNTIFKEMITKKNSITYKNFVRGFGKYFFGPFGIITQNNKTLRDYYLKKSALNSKIYAGKLEYYDYINKFSRYKQRLNISKKQILSISKNYLVLNDKNDLFTLKSLTSKRLFNKNKNFVDINRQKKRNSLTDINEIPLKYKKTNSTNISFYDKKFNNKSKNNIIFKLKSQRLGYLKTYSNIYSPKKSSKIGNYKKAVSEIKYNKKISNTSNSIKKVLYSSINSGLNKERNKNKENISNFFLTQSSFSKNKLQNKKFNFNTITNLKKRKISLNKNYKQINFRSIIFNK